MTTRVPDHLRSQTVFVDGQYVSGADATVSIFDRGFLMGDAVYEVTAIMDGRLLEFPAHMARLQRSVDALEIPYAVDHEALLHMHRELMRRNGVVDGLLYMQVSRGVAERGFDYPQGIEPTVIAFARSVDLRTFPGAETGVRVVSHPDGRWARRDIKTTQILWASMSKMAALRSGADDVFFVEDGYVTEGSACNAFIIGDGVLKSHALTHNILPGVTRAVIVQLAEEVGLRLVEEPFTIAEAQTADEVFITGSPIFAMGVVEVDGVTIGDGKPGPKTTRLRGLHIEASLQEGL